ncbi:MAG: DnaJ domain-containing protein, partial [Pseudomonadota bacterium]
MGELRPKRQRIMVRRGTPPNPKDRLGYYAALGVQPDAPYNDLLNAYSKRKAILEPYANELNGKDTYYEHQLVQDAWDILRLPGSRALYDNPTKRSLEGEKRHAWFRKRQARQFYRDQTKRIFSKLS